ncbi:MAG: exodeoxyribonuclease VII large subunit [Aggregatilineales bacterium]|nr:exodeoxyribonuclease VII large subunit [Aggregatilineales bacterium]HPV08015.1 exodeoxyribonuclease VII large subunit [Aggregatilineales bacterium]HQE16865.1 exodeoxyribonuclease VII large subunit [Aggregatilineales bacterium]
METQRWTVSELTRYLREQFESDPRLQDTEVEGEVSDFRIPGSGHAYFTLKDADATLQCVMWRSQLLAHRGDLPKHGDRVIAEGYISIYEPRGQYQLYCRRLRPAGRGDLHAEFERLKEKLAAEGLFDAERKRPVPVSPAVIGIVTSPSTAALQDVLNVLRRRRPQVRVVLSPTPVQGESAPPQIIRALEALNTQADVEVILLVRGGGSIEDLWCFNDEDLARAVAASRIPVIAGVGHEIDFTLVDFAADLRAPTPSAAAELATPITADHLRADVQRLSQRLFNAAALRTAEQRRAYEQAMYALRRLSPRAAIDNARQQVDGLVSRATRAVQSRFALRRSELAGLKRALKSMSPMETLARGYAIVQGPDGLVLHDPAQVRPGDRLHIRLEKGPLRATVDEEQDGIP